MATYAIGDIQGCYQSFKKLLNKISFDPHNDQLWLAGDMINRGMGSLETMIFILEHQNSVQCVLGNHDLHFLAVANQCKKITPKDTFSDILQSSLRHEIVHWLSQQPLAFYSEQYDTLMVHAGLPFSWSKQDALDYAKEVSDVLKSSTAAKFYSAMYGNYPDQWDNKLVGVERLRFITNSLTRMRFCYPDGRLELNTKSSPDDKTQALIPWFQLNNNKYLGNIVFGHWASLKGQCPQSNIHALDTGCVWGGELTALRLNDKQLFQVKNSE